MHATGVELSARQLIATSGDVLFVVWRSGFGVNEVRRVESRIHELSLARGRPVGVMIYLDMEPGDRPPSGLVRTAIISTWKGAEMRVAVTAIVHEGRGFISSLVRTVTNGIVMALRPAAPMRMHDDTAPAAAFLSRRLQGLLRPQELGALTHHLRDQLRAHAAEAKPELLWVESL